MNVRRGLLRLWVAGSIGWIAFVGYDAIRYWPSGHPVSDQWEFSIRPHLEWALGVPLAALALVLVIRWITAGFKQR
jgi:hypothetical protein